MARRRPMGPGATRGRAIDAWWTLPSETETHRKAIASAAIATAKAIAKDLRPRREEMLHHMRLYKGRYDLRYGSYTADMQPSYNITRSIIDTAQSLVVSSKPRPMFLTSDGGWELKQRAKLRARIIDGQFDIAGVDALRHQWFLDGAIVGVGILAPYIDPGSRQVLVQRVDPLAFLVDLNDGKGDSEPRVTYHVRSVDRGVMRAMYADDEGAQRMIDMASSPESVGFDSTMFLHRDTTADQIMVLESVHLPSGIDEDGRPSEDGKRICAVSSGVLGEVEEYCHAIQPYAFFRYMPDCDSFYGLSLAEMCRAPSRRLNRLNETIERASRLMSTAKFIVARGHKLDERDLGNGMHVLEYDERAGAPPPMVVPMSGVHPAWTEEKRDIREETFSATGLSTMVAEGQKPPGLNSGAAQLAHDDIHSRRHVVQQQQWEQGWMRLVSVFEILNDRNTDDGYDIPLPSKHRRGRREYVKDVKWSEVTQDAGKLYTRTFPVSSLPTTPRGKWALVKDWIASGFLSKMSAQVLMDFPDLEEQLGFELADLESVMGDIEAIIDGDTQMMPDPLVLPQMAVDIGRASYLQLRADEAPEEILEAVRAYVDGAKQLIELSQPQQPQQQAAGVAAPAQPMPVQAGPAALPQGAPS